MDYSLLMVIEFIENQSERTLFNQSDSDYSSKASLHKRNSIFVKPEERGATYSITDVCESVETSHNYTQIYHFGIIDYLQEFNIKKQLESKFKEV